MQSVPETPVEVPPSCFVLDELGVSLVVPAYNEEGRLPFTLGAYLDAFEGRGLPFEIIVVVDGSTDNTAKVARGFCDRNVHVLEFEQKLGKGGAVLEGFKAARYEVVGFLDADGPIAPTDFLTLVNRLDCHDGAIASRRMPDSKVTSPQPFARVVLSRVWNVLVRSSLGLPFSDTQCGAKVFRRSATLPVLRKVQVTNWAFDVDLLFHLQRMKRSVIEVPVQWAHDHDTRLATTRAIVAMLTSLVGIRLMNHPLSQVIPSRIASRLYELVATE